MKKQEIDKLIIVGAGETAEIAYEYFTYDSEYSVVGFTVEKNFLDKERKLGHPVVPFEEVERLYKPESHHAFVAISFAKLNRVRTRLFKETRAKGYPLASYVSSNAFVWHNVDIGENAFIFEDNVIQYGVKLGDNVTLWSGNHIGHQTTIKDNVFISSHVVVSGFCEIGEGSFLGVNSCLADEITIASDCVIGAGAVVLKDTEKGKVYIGNPARPTKKSSYESFNLSEEEI